MNDKINQLEKIIESYQRVVVGFSAGVDSTLVSFVSNKVLGKNALIVLARTETILEEDVQLARELASKYNFNYKEIEYNELEIENYANNPVNRCYFCKSELYSRLAEIAEQENTKYILDGANLDDLGDYRPGRLAAKEKEVKSPLIECGFTKQDVREAALIFGLPNHDKPSAPCLSSRIPYGTQIDRKSLEMIASGERFLRSFGFVNIRVRHYGEKAKIEVDKEMINILYENFDEVKSQFEKIGYKEIEIDPEGFASGKLNRNIINKIEILR
ncbi:MAG: ATP-dependent sacrificial sulfur transferase LarE [Ignavibacteria bacterium]|nr:ATP-dependent sacrificial sulfur transferase LarE [Ignavibacteria bacterium]